MANRNIIDHIELMDFLLARVLGEGLQREIPSAYVSYLWEIRNVLSGLVCFCADETEWDFCSWSMERLSKPSDSVRVSVLVPDMVAAIFCEMLVLSNGFSPQSYIMFLAGYCEAADTLRLKTRGVHVEIKSTALFEKQFGVKVRVEFVCPDAGSR